jgi:hypothetical protein
MVLKNSDGSIYQTFAPNPLSKEQQWIREENLIFHNWIWPTITIPRQKPARKTIKKSQEVIVQKQVTTQPIKQAIPMEPDPEPEPIEELVEEISKFQNGVMIHCLPVSYEMRSDELYGDRYKVESYGTKFMFEAVIMERGDLAMSIWTSETFDTPNGTVNTKKYIQPGSILFPTRYADGRRLGDHRWWKVQKLEAYDKGILITSVITDVHPSFT